MSEEIATYEERARAATKTSERELVEQANKEYAEFQALGAITSEKLIAFVNKGRDIGIRLQSIKATNKQWDQLALNFPEQFGKGFMRLAERMSKPATNMIEAVSSMKDVLMLQGTLPFPQTHGEQHLHPRDPFSAITRHVMEIQATFNKEIKERISNMTTEEKQFARDQIAPVVHIYELLAA